MIRNLAVVGEAAKSLPEDFKTLHNLIPWKKLAGVRDRLTHHDFGVNFDIVWNIAKEDLPEISAQFEKISFR